MHNINRIPVRKEVVAQRVNGAVVQTVKRSARQSTTRLLQCRHSNRSSLEQRKKFSAPDNWYEPTEENDPDDITISVHDAGKEYVHPASFAEVEERFFDFPESVRAPVEVIELSTHTRKHIVENLYGQQWGRAVYLYPVHESLMDIYHYRNQLLEQETKRFGGKWHQDGTDWVLQWTPQTIKDYYLENILPHEIGHVHDTRNTSYNNREAFANGFAERYGSPTVEYRKVTRRHHSV